MAIAYSSTKIAARNGNKITVHLMLFLFLIVMDVYRTFSCSPALCSSASWSTPHLAGLLQRAITLGPCVIGTSLCCNIARVSLNSLVSFSVFSRNWSYLRVERCSLVLEPQSFELCQGNTQCQIHV